MDKAKLIQAEIQKVFGDTSVNLVGGSVRDIIIGKEPKDWDYCTPLEPDEIEEKIRAAGRKPYLTGKRFGTIGFKVELLNQNPIVREYSRFVYIEVTTYRTEKYDGVSRKPEVEFSDDLMLDLSRRDFTINAIVLKEDGSFFDPHGGRLDILAKKIKAVGKGKDRIKEDPLRMLRAARFCSQLGFEVDPNFVGVMRQGADTIVRVSKERWSQELDKLLAGDDCKAGIEVLYQADLLKYMLPELHEAFREDETLIGLVSENIKLAQTVDEKWACLLYPVGLNIAKTWTKNGIKYRNHHLIRREILDGVCSRLKFSNARRDCLLGNIPQIKY